MNWTRHLFLVVLICISVMSCKERCLECLCTEAAGEQRTEKNCAYGSAGIDTQDTWRNEILPDQGCIDVVCEEVD